jgi:hypothetical protein
MIGALVAQSSEKAPFSSEIGGPILATDSWRSCEKSQSTLYRKSWVFSRYSGFLPLGMLTGWLGSPPPPPTDPSTVAVLRDQARVVRWLS